MSRALIVEDSSALTDCLRLILGSCVNEVDTCDSAIEAIQLINQHLPDVILLDVLLTGPDGFTLLNELASYQDTMQIPVILLSSLDLTHRRLDGYGVVQIFDKTTMRPEEIRQTVQAVLQKEYHVG